MGIMPVKPLVISMALPMMISMLVQALYNVVDSIFVAQLNENALTAVTLAFPIQNLVIAVGSGTGVGINALLSRSLGSKNFEDADGAANTGILLNIIHYALFVLFGIFGAHAFIASQASDAEIIELGNSYLMIVCIGAIAALMQMTLERLLQSTGRTFYSMISQLTGAIINIILDPIMIFGLLGFPKLGVAGAAIATVCGQISASGVALYLNVFKNKEINVSLGRILKPRKIIVRKIYEVGIPSMIMVSIGSIMTYCLNIILMKFSSTATAVFGAYFKLQSFFFMPVFGMNNGIIPIMAYNYGAKNKERIYETLNFAYKLAVTIMVIGTLVMEFIPQILLGLFNASDSMLEIGVPALRIIAVHFPIAAIAIVMGSVFQAFAQGLYSMLVSLGRQLFVLIPVAWLLSLSGNVDLVWLCFLISEIVSLLLSIFFYRKVKKNIIDQI
ncbi:Multi antimicrobial extrusion protein (Na(+)/drug antiporter), MATE family of MDR efflux pump [Lachnospiraceae bacterium TWA4]|nr:Multi antimicrobial extrusion protein (Na(+)/drug antiporter), MATE family of MDR efflux pump [Lachnospiraceae bacterium TWA4]